MVSVGHSEWPVDVLPHFATVHNRLGYTVRPWTSGDLAFAAVSDIPAAELDGFIDQFRIATR